MDLGVKSDIIIKDAQSLHIAAAATIAAIIHDYINADNVFYI